MTEYCPRCDDYLDDDRVRADDALVCLGCTDEEERGDLLLKAQAEIAALEREIERLRDAILQVLGGATATDGNASYVTVHRELIGKLRAALAHEQSSDTTQKA